MICKSTLGIPCTMQDNCILWIAAWLSVELYKVKGCHCLSYIQISNYQWLSICVLCAALLQVFDWPIWTKTLTKLDFYKLPSTVPAWSPSHNISPFLRRRAKKCHSVYRYKSVYMSCVVNMFMLARLAGVDTIFSSCSKQWNKQKMLIYVYISHKWSKYYNAFKCSHHQCTYDYIPNKVMWEPTEVRNQNFVKILVQKYKI